MVVTRWGLLAVLWAVLGLLIVYPVGSLLLASFTNAPPGVAAPLTLQSYIEAYTDPFTYRTLTTSLSIVLFASTGALLVAIGFAWLIGRTNVPKPGLLELLVVLPFFVPPLLTALGWHLLANPRNGALNLVLAGAGAPFPLFDINSVLGVAFHIGLSLTGFAYLLIVGPFRAMDHSLEEAAAMSGVGPTRTFLQITLPMLAPALLGALSLVFVRGMEAFESPLFLGVPGRVYVFTTGIYDALRFTAPPRYGYAAALAVVLLVLVGILVVAQWRLLGRRRFFTVQGRAYQVRVRDVGPWRWLIVGAILVYAATAIVLPLSQIILGSFQPVLGVLRFGILTISHYEATLGDPIFWRALRNTVVVSAVAALACSGLAALLGYLVIRTQLPTRRGLDVLTWLPIALPGTVLGMSLLWAYLSLPGLRQLYQSVWLLGVAYVTLGLPMAARGISGGLHQLTPELEEAAHVHGAGRLRTWWLILIPILRPTFLATWLLLFVLFSRELGATAFLFGPGSETLATAMMGYWQGGQSERAAVVAVVLIGILVGVVAGMALVLRTMRMAEESGRRSTS